MAEWYFSAGGNQIGPMDDSAARGYAAANPSAYCWRAGFAEWLKIEQVAELREGPVPGAPTPPPTPPRAGGLADEIDFTLHGQEMQFIEIELDPGESAVAEAGAMMYKDSTIVMRTVFGDGSGQGQGATFLNKLIGAGKRVVSGESLFTTVFTHEGSDKAHVAFAAPYPGNILALKLSDYGGRLICQKDAFLAAAKGVQLGIHFQRKILTGLFGGEGFIMQRLDGDGWVFVHMGGTVVERELAPGELLHVDTGCLAALSQEVEFDIEQAGGIKSMLFGGEGLFFARLRGPGKIWLQSLPFSRLAGRMLAGAPQRGGSQGEGSILGTFGNLLDGDNR